MTFRGYLLTILAATLIAWAGWLFVLFNVTPGDSGWTGYTLFYLTLLMALMGTLTLLESVARVYLLRRRELVIREVKIAFRHAVILSFLAVISLFLSAQDWIHWWTILVLIIAAGVIEYFSLLVQSGRRQ